MHRTEVQIAVGSSYPSDRVLRFVDQKVGAALAFAAVIKNLDPFRSCEKLADFFVGVEDVEFANDHIAGKRFLRFPRWAYAYPETMFENLGLGNIQKMDKRLIEARVSGIKSAARYWKCNDLTTIKVVAERRQREFDRAG